MLMIRKYQVLQKREDAEQLKLEEAVKAFVAESDDFCTEFNCSRLQKGASERQAEVSESKRLLRATEAGIQAHNSEVKELKNQIALLSRTLEDLAHESQGIFCIIVLHSEQQACLSPQER